MAVFIGSVRALVLQASENRRRPSPESRNSPSDSPGTVHSSLGVFPHALRESSHSHSPSPSFLEVVDAAGLPTGAPTSSCSGSSKFGAPICGRTAGLSASRRQEWTLWLGVARCRRGAPSLFAGSSTSASTRATRSASLSRSVSWHMCFLVSERPQARTPPSDSLFNGLCRFFRGRTWTRFCSSGPQVDCSDVATVVSAAR